MVSYRARKTQTKQKEARSIQNEGIEYNSSDSMITDIFDDPIEINTEHGAEKVKRSMIYIVSKHVDGRTFIKIGASKSTRSSTGGRLGDLQTLLLPGLANIGFRLIYIFIYPYQTLTGEGYSEHIEKALHKYMREYSEYETTVLQFPTGKPSEWYLPEPNGYEQFLKFVLEYISVQIPFPEASYHFFMESQGANIGLKPRRISNVVKVSTRTEILQFRHDFTEMKKTAQKKRKDTIKSNAQNEGNATHFRERLLQQKSVPPLGEKIRVKQVKYFNGVTNNSQVHGHYYVNIERGKMKRKEKKKTDRLVRYKDAEGEWVHIADVLIHMQSIGTLEMYDLVTNFNHYNKGPIEKAKDFLEKYNPEDGVRLKRSELDWIIGRSVVDKNEHQFEAIGLVTTRGQRVKAVKFRATDGQTKMANPVVAMTLAVDYHNGDLNQTHAITDDYMEETSPPTYQKGDFIQFKANYFTSHETNEPMPDEFIAFVLKDPYLKFDQATNQYEMFYDLLFENDLWSLNASSTDANSKRLDETLVKAKQAVHDFLAAVTKHRNLVMDEIVKYNLAVSLSRTRKRKGAVRHVKGTRRKKK